MLPQFDIYVPPVFVDCTVCMFLDIFHVYSSQKNLKLWF